MTNTNTNTASAFDENDVAAILSMSEDDLADHYVAMRRRMGGLPTKCADDVLDCGRGRTLVFRIVLGKAAVSALGQPARALCDQLDQLGAEHNTLIDRSKTYNVLSSGIDPEVLVVRKLADHWLEELDLSRTAAEMTFARLLGLRYVLHVQLRRESYERSAMFVPLEWRLPTDADGGSSPPSELELVPVDLKTTGSNGEGDGEDSGGGGAAPAAPPAPAVPAAVVTEPPDPDPAIETYTDDDDKHYDLNFLDLDRKG
jgi:hypothetical protein